MTRTTLDPSAPSTVDEARFVTLLRDVSVVSFDAFDTLIERPLEHPTHVFDLFEDTAAEIAGYPTLPYRAVRIDAENAARASLGDTKDPSTAAIAEVLASRLGAEPAIGRRLLEAETAFERGLLRARPAGMALFQAARAAGLPIVVTSDTRFDPQTLRSLLEGTGYVGVASVRTSSSSGASKRDGALFERLVAELGVPAARILHVGDHAIFDVARAIGAGLRALHLPKVESTYLGSPSLERVYGRHAERLDIATRARTCVAARRLGASAPSGDSQFGGCARTLGYLGLGPLLLGLGTFVLDRAEEDRVSHLHFLARDGRLVKDAVALLAAARTSSPTLVYLLASRRVAQVAALETTADVLARVASLRALGSVRDTVEHRLGLPVTEIPRASLARHGLDLETRVGDAGRPALVALARELAPAILANAAREREAYRTYLAAAGFRADATHAVVDLGYAGTLQLALDALGPGAGGLRGYYLLTYREAPRVLRRRGLRSRAYAGEAIERDDDQLALARRIALVESLFLCDEDSVVRFRLEGSDAVAERRPRDADERTRSATVARIQEGALAYVRDMVEAFANVPAVLELAPSRASRALDVFLEDPSPEDAALLADLAFEDHFAAAGIRPLVSTTGGPSLWPEGALALRLGDRPSTSIRRALGEVDWMNGRFETLARGLSPLVGPIVDRLAPRLLPPTKLDKFLREPRRFFADAGGVPTRALGRVYSHHRRRKDRSRT